MANSAAFNSHLRRATQPPNHPDINESDLLEELDISTSPGGLPTRRAVSELDFQDLLGQLANLHEDLAMQNKFLHSELIRADQAMQTGAGADGAGTPRNGTSGAIDADLSGLRRGLDEDQAMHTGEDHSEPTTPREKEDAPTKKPFFPSEASRLSLHKSLSSSTFFTVGSISEPEPSKLADAKRQTGIHRRTFKRLQEDCAEKHRNMAAELDAIFEDERKQSKIAGRSTNSNFTLTFAAIARSLNKAQGREDSGDEITFETFVDIMSIQSLPEDVDLEVLEKIQALRNMFATKDMVTAMAKFAHVKTRDLRYVDQGERRTIRSLVEKAIDPASFFIIMSNTLTITVSADADPDWPGWEVFEYFFTCFFVLELCVKVWLLGLCEFLLGIDWKWNCADVIFVLLAVIDAALSRVNPDSNLQLFTLMRLVRLARITRLIRLLRFKVFKELLLMIRGVLGGLRTLFWAIILLIFVIVILGLLMRQTLGRWCETPSDLCTSPHLIEHGDLLFSDVPRACFTIFRCFTEGCASVDGTPLLVSIYENNWTGPIIVTVYVLAFLVVTFGLFNLIMAVFVENTVETAKLDDEKRQRMRMKDNVQVARKLQQFVVKFCKASTQTDDSQLVEPTMSSRRMSTSGPMSLFSPFQRKADMEDDEAVGVAAMDVKITRDLFQKVMSDPQAEQLLGDLEVHVSDHMMLFETLDADCSGSLDVAELVKGIMQLRGSADKFDVVASLLTVRAMQKNLRAIEAKVNQGQRRLEGKMSTLMQSYTKRATESFTPRVAERTTSVSRLDVS